MLAHSLLSRNKSDCQTDYKLRNFGNRNYLHAAANIQLFIVGIKISKMEKMDSNLFKKFADAELNNNATALIEGGAGPGSSSTGDTDCTNRGGSGADCGDITTDAIFDTDPTSTNDDTCRIG